MPLIVTPRQLVHRAQFYRQLSQMTAAGLPFISALNMQLENPPARSYREPIRAIIGQLGQGSTIAEALQHQGSWMPTFDLALVEAGEKSGRLDSVFKMLAEYYEENAAILRKLIGDLAYPVFLLHFAALVFSFPFFQLFQAGLNWGHFGLKVFMVLLPFYAILSFVLIVGRLNSGSKWRRVFERLIRLVPLLGAARHFLALSRLCAALEALINAGVNIIPAWEMAAAASGSPALQRTVLSWRPKFDKGQTPAEAINQTRSQFPELFANLYQSGEVSGQLDQTLRRLHAYYKEEGSFKLKMFTKILSKAVYFMVAGYIAYSVVKFYSGLFNLEQKSWSM